MNPVTATLIRQVDDKKIVRFVEQWDELEALVIRVYKTARATPDDLKLYARLKPALLKQLDRYGAALDAYWPEATVGGKPAARSPFDVLMGHSTAADFVGNWPAMQHLPAARQAINEWLLDKLRGTA